MGPSNLVKCYNGYYVNGFKFHTQSYGRFKKTMNSGVCVKGSCYDANECDYYGMLEEVVRLKYLGSKCKVFMFKCHWYDTRRGIRMHRSNGLVEIKHTSRLYGNEDFVLAQQCQQVYYTCPPDNKSSEWWAVVKTTARSRYNVNMGEFIEDDNNTRSFDVAQLDEISQPCRVLPTQTLDDPNIFVEASYYTEINHCELLQLQANSVEVERVSNEEFDDDVNGNYDDDDDDVVMSDDNDEQHDDDIL
jgi:hypothetical protein